MADLKQLAADYGTFNEAARSTRKTWEALAAQQLGAFKVGQKVTWSSGGRVYRGQITVRTIEPVSEEPDITCERYTVHLIKADGSLGRVFTNLRRDPAYGRTNLKRPWRLGPWLAPLED